MLCHVSKFITHKQTTNYMLKILGKGYLRWRVGKMMMIRNSTCNNTCDALNVCN